MGKAPVSGMFFLATALGSLTACGGGGGGGGGGVSSIAPPPAPPPPPSFAPVNIFPSITTSTDLAALGYELSSSPGAPLTGDGFSVRYDSASNLYIVDLPSHAPGALYATSSSETYWNAGLPAGSILWPPMAVLKPTPTNPLIQLNYTSLASYMKAGPMEDLPHGVVAFGVPTAASAMPTIGSATMNAMVVGLSNNGLDTVGGTATLTFDFNAGTLAGHFEPVLTPYYGTESYGLGTYTFNNTVFGVGSTTFSGNFVHSDPTLTGAFNGLFTGPVGEELMARWTADYFVQGVTTQPEKMFGVWVGKKCC